MFFQKISNHNMYICLFSPRSSLAADLLDFRVLLLRILWDNESFCCGSFETRSSFARLSWVSEFFCRESPQLIIPIIILQSFYHVILALGQRRTKKYLTDHIADPFAYCFWLISKGWPCRACLSPVVVHPMSRSRKVAAITFCRQLHIT